MVMPDVDICIWMLHGGCEAIQQLNMARPEAHNASQIQVNYALQVDSLEIRGALRIVAVLTSQWCDAAAVSHPLPTTPQNTANARFSR